MDNTNFANDLDSILEVLTDEQQDLLKDIFVSYERRGYAKGVMAAAIYYTNHKEEIDDNGNSEE